MPKSKTAQMKKDMTRAMKVVDRAAKAFRSACERSKKGDLSCKIYKALSRAAGTIDTSRDFVSDIF